MKRQFCVEYPRFTHKMSGGSASVSGIIHIMLIRRECVKKNRQEVLHIIHGFVSLCCTPETRINSSARKTVSFVSRPPNNNSTKCECLPSIANQHTHTPKIPSKRKFYRLSTDFLPKKKNRKVFHSSNRFLDSSQICRCGNTC